MPQDIKEPLAQESDGLGDSQDIEYWPNPAVLTSTTFKRAQQERASEMGLSATEGFEDNDLTTQEPRSIERGPDLYKNSDEPSVLNQIAQLCGNVRVQYTKVATEADGGTTTSSDRPPLIQEISQVNTKVSYAMEFTSHYNKKDERVNTTVTLHSEGLRKLIKSTMGPILEHENSGSFDGPMPIIVSTDNVLVLHSWDHLWAAAESQSDTDEGMELQCYLKNLARYESEPLQARAAAQREGQVEYNKMWTLFPPGSEVVATPFQDSHQIFTVYRHGPSRDGNGFQFSCWAYDWDGQALVRTAHEFVVKKFMGMKKVTELQCYPLSFYKYGREGPDELRQRLTDRGKMFEKFCKQGSDTEGASPALWRCDKFTTTHPPTFHDIKDAIERLLPKAPKATISTSQDGKSAPVIIDPGQYAIHALNTEGSPLHLGDMVPRSKKPCECRLCTVHGARTIWDRQFADADEKPLYDTLSTELDRQFYSQLPPRVLGFIVDQKAWGQLQVEHIIEEKSTDPGTRPSTAWIDLSLEEEHKRNIEKMVRTHFKVSDDESLRLRIRDPVKDKGEGLVILLHGLPGLGKTMTAEGLAQKTNRRLIRIDATDFHYSDPSQVSQAFQKYFHCAHKWGTLLLLDEADVFLQSRKARDLAQNALVSVLLRELEYFKGVLIMTTNRVLTIDTAMESRIHYTVKFRDLNQTSLVQIFETFARQLNKENCRDEDKREILAWVKAEASDLVQKSLTGRDIRNILTTAQLLDWPFITHDNFRAILRNTGNFRQDMAARANAEHEANAAPRQRQAY